MCNVHVLLLTISYYILINLHLHYYYTFNTGTWVDGMKTGTVTYIDGPNSESYVGEYIRDKVISGAGKIVLNTTAYYVGEVNNNNMHGKGTLYNNIPLKKEIM